MRFHSARWVLAATACFAFGCGGDNPGLSPAPAAASAAGADRAASEAEPDVAVVEAGDAFDESESR